MTSIRLLSSDLNGTLVHPHTMQDMIRVGFPREPGRFARAREAFALQTEGKLSMPETFRIAGRESRGLPLRLAIDYAMGQMAFVTGYHTLVSFLRDQGMAFAIVSTGYTVTLHAIRHGTSPPPFHVRCNRLLFADRAGRILEEVELEDRVRRYLKEPRSLRRGEYDEIQATGEVILGIRDEGDKARLAIGLARTLGIPPQGVAHMGDTMGDSGGILGVARAGGLGIAFNYNPALEDFLRKEGGEELEKGRVVLVDPKGPGSNLERVLPFLGRG